MVSREGEGGRGREGGWEREGEGGRRRGRVGEGGREGERKGEISRDDVSPVLSFTWPCIRCMKYPSILLPIAHTHTHTHTHTQRK